MAASRYYRTGQNHDRIDEEDYLIGTAAARMSVGGSGDGSGNDGLDITATQKMMSAVTGSLFTSLLVTPLDVVRVRLQSQNPAPKANIDFSRLAMTARSLTPAQTTELGVTACCREVFFMGDNIESCVAAPRSVTTAINTNAAATAFPPAHDCAVEEVQKRTYKSTMDGMRKIARNEGFTALWRGLSPTLVMMVPANLIYFTGYEWLRYDTRSPFSRLSDHYAPLTGGSVARVLAVTAVSPIELVRTRMQAASSDGSRAMVETFKGIGEMVSTHGYGSLWRGLTLTLWRDVPFSGLYWWGYETIRGRLTDMRDEARGRQRTRDAGSRMEERRRSRSNERHTETFADSFAAGAMSGAFASIVTMPFDVGKTRTQVYRDSAGAESAGEKRTMSRLLWHIFRTEGLAGLWRGWIPRTLKVAPSCAIMISTYEVGKRVFRGVNERAAEDRARRQ